MFREWGFLMGEMWVLLALAALVGLIAGWLIWGRSDAAGSAVDTAEADRLRRALADCEAKGQTQSARLMSLERDLTAAELRAKHSNSQAEAADARAAHTASEAAKVTAAPIAAPVMAPIMAAPVASGAKVKPATLTAPRGGKADDLKLIKGVGPKLAALCNQLGFYHFDQIASWTDAEIAWVDENLEGFKGRVERDEWVVQARDLAAGKPPRAGGEN